MMVWWSFLFALGVMMFHDTFFGVGATFREITATVLLLVSLGLLSRIWRKMRVGERERLSDRIAHLERELMTVRAKQTESQSEAPATAPI